MKSNSPLVESFSHWKRTDNSNNDNGLLFIVRVVWRGTLFSCKDMNEGELGCYSALH